MLQLQPPSAILVGPSGSGKTSAIATQLLAGLDTFVIVTEPGGVESLLDSAERLKAPIDRLHWTSALPAAAGWSGLEDMISKINSMDQKGLADIRDMGKADFRPAAMKFLNSFRNFTCERTGGVFGDMSTWDDTRSLNIDSLTGWSTIAWGATVGFKPTANPGEWGIGQNFIFNMLMKINSDRKCFFNLTAHQEKEMDENLGVKKMMVSTIGAKLAPKIPPFFSEVIKTQRVMDSKGGAEFTWSTLATDMDLKNRALPINAKLPADFRQIVEAYKRRKTLAKGNVAAPTAAEKLPAVPNVPAPATK
jgi:hypothetical protein